MKGDSTERETGSEENNLPRNPGSPSTLHALVAEKPAERLSIAPTERLGVLNLENIEVRQSPGHLARRSGERTWGPDPGRED